MPFKRDHKIRFGMCFAAGYRDPHVVAESGFDQPVRFPQVLEARLGRLVRAVAVEALTSRGFGRDRAPMFQPL